MYFGPFSSYKKSTSCPHGVALWEVGEYSARRQVQDIHIFQKSGVDPGTDPAIDPVIYFGIKSLFSEMITYKECHGYWACLHMFR